jgi:hypothetical protein
LPGQETELGAALWGLAALQDGERLYGVVDGARSGQLVTEALVKHPQPLRSLFEGPSADDLRDVAPYLVEVDPDGLYLDRWAQRWGTHSGILLVTTAQPDALRGHLRGLFAAKDEQGQEFFFRFYDPRVLRVYLPTCTPAEAAEFFGPVRQILVEDAKPDGVLLCTPSRAGVQIQRMPVPAPAPGDAAAQDAAADGSPQTQGSDK